VELLVSSFFLFHEVEQVVLNSGFKCSNYNYDQWGLMKNISDFFSPFSFRTMKPPKFGFIQEKKCAHISKEL
jgi:hypothetical protein